MDKLTMIVALVHCLSNENVESADAYTIGRNCGGCPLEDENGCMYSLKMETIKSLLSQKVLLSEQEFDALKAWVGEFNA